jgi:Domain of unknown function (DUF4838)/Glycosyl hydrolase family 67 N-terminus
MMRRKRHALVVFVSMGAFAAIAAAEGKKNPFPAMGGPFHELVEEGKPVAAIVAQDEAPLIEGYAAEELQRYVHKMTGAELAIASAAPADTYPIYVGAAARKRLPGFDWESLGDEGFVLRSTDEGLHIAGAKDLGTLYGVYTLLERFGCRWFVTGDIGEVVPSSQSLRVGTLDETQTPSFRYRWIDSGDWAIHNKMNISVEVEGKPVGPQWRWSYHTHFLLVPPEEYYDEHPKWFAEVGGRRPRPEDKHHQGRQLCTSNPELIEQMAENVVAFFKENAEVDILSLAPQDGGGFCECPACRALDEDRPENEAWHARYSNRLAVFNNEVARRVGASCPDKIIKVGAYAMYVRVPSDPAYRPEPNLAVQVCHTYSCNNHAIDSDCARQEQYFGKELARWAEITNHLFIYEYYRKGMWGGMPFDQVHVIRHDMPYYHRIGVEGFYTQPARDRWPSCGLNHYVAAKLIWDVDLDVDLLLADYYAKFFGEAAEPMGRYYEGLMAAFVDYGDCISPYGYKWPTFAASEIFTAEVVARLNGALADAERAAAQDIVRERIRPIRARIEYVERVLDYLRAVRAPFDGIDLADKAALEAAHGKAQEIGAPLSRAIKAFCKKNDVRSFGRIDAAHENLRFLVVLPGEEPLLR